MSRPSKASERREEIALGLYQCLVKSNFGDVSVKQIAAEAEVAPGIVHHYFADKEEIFIELAVLIRNQYETLLDEHLGGLDNSVSRRQATLEFVVDRFILDRSLNRVFYNLVQKALDNEQVGQPMRALLDRYRERLEEEFSSSDNPDNSIPGAAIVAQIEGLALQHMVDPTRFSRVDHLELLSSFLKIRLETE